MLVSATANQQARHGGGGDLWGAAMVDHETSLQGGLQEAGAPAADYEPGMGTAAAGPAGYKGETGRSRPTWMRETGGSGGRRGRRRGSIGRRQRPEMEALVGDWWSDADGGAIKVNGAIVDSWMPHSTINGPYMPSSVLNRLKTLFVFCATIMGIIGVLCNKSA